MVIHNGQVWWASPDPTMGREQAGRRPILVVSNGDFYDTVVTLVLVVPITSVDRGWPNHVPVPPAAGLERPCWAMTEQVRAISRDRLVSLVGRVDHDTLVQTRRWITDYLR